MDEVVFRTSHTVDTLQYQLKVAAYEGKNILAQFSERVKDATVEVLNNPRFSHVQDSVKKLFTLLVKIAHEAKEYVIEHYHPRIMLLRLSKLLGRNFSKRDVIIGSTSLLIGVIIGFSISYVIPRKQEIFRTMHAIQCVRYSGVEAAVLVEDALGPKECAKNEVLVNIKAASVNVIDIEICKGYGSLIRSITRRYFRHYREELPVTLGRDCTGIIVDIGKNVSRLDIGDEVWLSVPFWAPGTMAEYIVVSENKVSHKPKGSGFEGAASLPYCGCMVLSMLQKYKINFHSAKTKKIFVHGGCTAAGCILLQILIAWGAKITTSCYKRAVPVAKALGAQDIIELPSLSSIDPIISAQNAAILKAEFRNREKFDAIITTIECELSNRELLEYCKTGGAVISTLPEVMKCDSNTFFLRTLYSIRIRISCFIQNLLTGTLYSFGEEYVSHKMLEQLAELVETGKIQTVVDRVFKPHDIEHALNHIQSSESIGSTVITFR